MASVEIVMSVHKCAEVSLHNMFTRDAIVDVQLAILRLGEAGLLFARLVKVYLLFE